MASKSKKPRTPKKSTSTLPQVDWSLVLKIIVNVGVVLLAWLAFTAIMQKKASTSKPVYECSETVAGYSPVFCGKHLSAFKSLDNNNVIMVKTSKPSALDKKSNVVQTLVDVASKSSVFSVHMKMVDAIVERSPQRVLLLGLGGGAIPLMLSELLPDCELVAVDLYQDALDIARKFVKADDGTKIQYVRANAQRYIQTAETGSFDVVISDVFQGSYLPEFVFEESYLNDVKRVMRDDAIYLVNLFVPEWATDRVIKMFMTLKKAFPTVDFVDAGDKTSFILSASKVEKPKEPESDADDETADDEQEATADQADDKQEATKETPEDASANEQSETPESESL